MGARIFMHPTVRKGARNPDRKTGSPATSNPTESVIAVLPRKASSRQTVHLESTALDIAADMMEFRDGVSGGHAARTRRYLQLLIEAMLERHVYFPEVSAWNLELMLASARLHDIGKIAISDALLNKPDKLTLDEFERIKAHAPLGVAILERIEKTAGKNIFLNHAKLIAGTHHEKWDGSGYPYGLRGRAIPLEGRLMAIADVYDALTSSRPYKNSFPVAEAEDIIIQAAGTHFDPALIDVFLRVADRFADIAVQEEPATASGIIDPSLPPSWIHAPAQGA